MTNPWPFEDDADRDDPLTALRIAVTSSHPQWCYIVGYDRTSAARPTGHEAAMLASFLQQYIDYWYNDSYKAKLAQRALDVDGGANGIVFRKYGENDWAYRRRTWNVGPMFVPGPPSLRDRSGAPKPTGPFSLAQLMDRIHSDGDGGVSKRWADWKSAHADLFTEQPA